MAYTLEEFRRKVETEKRESKSKKKPTREEMEDAWYDALSDVIDQHPIGLSGRRR